MRPSAIALFLAAATTWACAAPPGGSPDTGDGGAPDAGDPPDAGVEPTWREVRGPAPAPRWGHVAAVDPDRRRALVFGGTGTAGRLGDLWAFDLKTEAWQSLAAPGGPTPRFTAAAVVDPIRRRLIVVGGDDGAPSAEVWAWSFADGRWSRLASGPSPRFDLAAACCGPQGSPAWFYGGFGTGFVALDDLWELNLANDTWRRLPDGGRRPSARTNVGFGYFVVGPALALHGGHDAIGLTPDTWEYDLRAQAWKPATVPGTPAAWAHFASVALPTRADLFLVGGDNNDGRDVATTDVLRGCCGGPVEIHRLPAKALPPPRRHAVTFLDPATSRLVVFGGWQGAAVILGDTWIYEPGTSGF